MWWTAIAFGLLSSLHCMGMCGPIALAVPVGNGNAFSKYFKFLIYNLGRVISYGALGFLFGMIGVGLHLAGFQQWVSIVAGAIIMISVIFIYYLPKKSNLSFITSIIQKPFQKFFSKKSFFSVMMIGVLNGLLPCGMVYLALAGATAQSSLFNSVGYMLLFGLGTIPALFALKISSDFITSGFKYKVRKLVPVFTLVIGLLFVLRGLGLGIPMVSPEIITEKNEKGEIIEKASCCKNPSLKNKKSDEHSSCKMH